ncbi:hypothetical protein C9374_007822 [Naegleria lovaniensis]|uniref:nitric-oxide synthase (NADPH) n=1 Tax=Naegleria lovaniensis TaxID=51637 RepID=A0AA88KLA5_NAELO|nr:uncharacterized protein C9374_007822 [Naegleria lovaniensis]KAG2378674.1 hypothetical protein C9374_007822 [Naegleria lovaniensis]
MMTVQEFSTCPTQAASTIKCTAPLLLDHSELFQEATTFLTQLFSEMKKPEGALSQRLQEVKQEIEQTGTYTHTSEELTMGCKIAWRNTVNCIGKTHWQVLTVHDQRHCQTEQEIFKALKHHTQCAFNHGNIKSSVTLFRPCSQPDGSDEIRIYNPQIIRYAGYENEDGSVLGDPEHVQMTKVALELGWKPPQPRTRFDILPLIIQMGMNSTPKWFELPPEYTTEVSLEHPKFEKTSDMKLKWHALPAITNMRFEMGGIFYTAAAFNGWYMTTEITRNFLDFNRYNLIDEFGAAIGVRPESDTESKKNPLWKDVASAEFNIMVQYSFEKAGVKIVDHHTAGKQFCKHIQNEERQGRECPARYSWIVPPSASHLIPVFHLRMREFVLKPTISYQPEGSYQFTFTPKPRGEIVPEDEDWKSESPLQQKKKKINSNNVSRQDSHQQARASHSKKATTNGAANVKIRAFSSRDWMIVMTLLGILLMFVAFHYSVVALKSE